MEIQSRASTLASFLDWICFSVCSLYFKEKVTSVNHWVPLQSFYPAPTMQCFIFSWVAVMHAMRVKQTNWEMPGAFSLIFWFLFPCKCKENTTLHHSASIFAWRVHTAQRTGNYDFTYMLNCFFSSPARGKTIHIVAVITLFLFVSVSASLEVFQSGWHCGEGLQRPLWSFPSVKLPALCDVLIGQ